MDIVRLPISESMNTYKPWKIRISQSHILHSKCSKDEKTCATDPCHFCIYNRTLTLPHLPDMVFPNNILALEHEEGAKIEFNALDALKRVADGKINLQLPCAEAWKESRSDCKEFLEEKVKPFDWTFTTDYMGTISGFHVEETEQRIDFNELMRRDEIRLYKDLTLFEDEVHDHGRASLFVKIRIMPRSLFILLRYFLRIDHRMLKINDTRIFHDFKESYLLREYTSRQSEIKHLKIPHSLLIDPSLIAEHLPLKHSFYHKLSILPKPEEDTAKSSKSENTNDIVQSTKKNSELQENTKQEKGSSNLVT